MERRKFISSTSLAGLASVIGAPIVFANNITEDYPLLALQDVNPFELFKKNKQMVVLNDKPWNIEAQAHLLNDVITPNSAMFVRNNGKIPEKIDAKNWKLVIDGESVHQSKTYSLQDLKSQFKQYSYQLTLECGGNGRSEFNPPAKGNQWTVGAVSCAKWTGVRLKDVLAAIGIKNNAVYVGYHAADTHLSGDPRKEPISRGIPIAKALQDETLLAFEMNGEAIPLAHGYPLRLVAGGYPASVSGKWINRISVRDKVHDGEKMSGDSYRVPKFPVAPGESVKAEDMQIIESMPVKSLITYPKSGATMKLAQQLHINGHAWAGELNVAKVMYSIDFGSTWHSCTLKNAVNRFAWQQFAATIQFPQKGYYEVWAKAIDSKGVAQPMLVPGWNPKGYLNNACHRIAVKIV
ncbi:sulfite oxidase [Cellulophaga tyrosinoxydans]|uniref:Mo-co oxidoreductase dimerisation domain-containing protein n=1 Tax=Cellulophaga tyrosinoxydans TaxID=504486 RepID=A0A1W2BPJ2_9FLAO|nr:sulfite oxidase [Cellulophaga tyrosinoxydans]SMC74847.1 Mo-co oxidoreductase dimerisation domain-containing protein [Cellulophaga tyrosinoxydans]